MTMTAKQFKNSRIAINLTQTEMGERLGGYKWRTVASWEAGDRSIPLGVQKLMEEIVDKEETLAALVQMLINFGADPANANEASAWEGAIQTVEKVAGMPFGKYLQERM